MLTTPVRLQNLLKEFSAYGGTSDGGMNRVALTEADRAARDAFQRWMEVHGLKLTVDSMGNMFGFLELAGPDAPIVMAGSHLDSQPHGGRLDGAYGVLAVCEAILAVRDHFANNGETALCNLAIVNWTNEEGARFQPSILGSSVYAGLIDRDYALARTDGDGVSVGEALAAIGYAGTGSFPKPQAFLELHVECNTSLEEKGKRFGAVTHHWGATKIRLAFIGRQAHTGPTAMTARRDALLAAAHLITRIRELADESPAKLHTSVGRLEVVPNSPNVVPGEVVMFIELRSANQNAMDWAEAEVLNRATVIASEADITYEVRATDRRAVGYFDADLTSLAVREAAMLGEPVEHLDCVAANDANCMIHLCPTIILMVPSIGGVCHHPSEQTAQADLDLGAELLARVMLRLCKDGIPPNDATNMVGGGLVRTIPPVLRDNT